MGIFLCKRDLPIKVIKIIYALADLQNPGIFKKDHCKKSNEVALVLHLLSPNYDFHPDRARQFGGGLFVPV